MLPAVDEEERSPSNQVWKHVNNDGSKVTLFLPAYLRVAFKKITTMDIPDNSAEMAATLLLTVRYRGLGPHTVDAFIQGMEISLNSEQFHSLNPFSKKSLQHSGRLHYTKDQRQGEVTFQWRTRFPLELQCEGIFYSPFNLLQLELTCTLRSVSWEFGQQKITVKFNLMTLDEDQVYRLFSVHTDEKGEYAIAQGKVSAQVPFSLNEQDEPKPPIHSDLSGGLYANVRMSESKVAAEEDPRKSTEQTFSKLPPLKSRKSKLIEMKDSLDNWQHIRFQVGMYKYPLTTILSLFFPLVLLAIINLAIFFQSNDLGARIASIATLLVAYSAFLPTVRQLIPTTPEITAMDIILVLFALTELLTLLRAFLDYKIPAEQYNYQWNEDPIIIVCIVLILIVVVSVTVMLILHKCLWEPGYNRRRGTGRFSSGKFDSSVWFNTAADEYFKKISRRQGISVLSTHQQEEFAEEELREEQPAKRRAKRVKKHQPSLEYHYSTIKKTE